MSEQEKILDRVRKLLELAKSDNVNEAANAAAQAQTLMSRHAIDDAMLTTQTADEAIETDILSAAEGRKLATWRWQLASALCYVNQCKGYASGANKSEIRIIGRPSDAAKARYIFTHVAGEIERLCKQEGEARGTPGKTWYNNFRIGAAEVVANRLRQAHREAVAAMRKEADASDTLGTGAALVRVNTAIAKLDTIREDVELYGKTKLHLRSTRSSRHFRNNSDGREAGRRAGAGIGLSPATGGTLGSGSRARLGS